MTLPEDDHTLLWAELDEAAQTFFMGIHGAVQGTSSASVAIQTIAAQLGISKNEGRTLAENLIGLDLIEIRTLSGAVGLTATGRLIGETQAPAINGLGSEPCLGPAAVRLISALVPDIECAAGRLNISGIDQAEWACERATLDLQLASPRPKTTIVRSVLSTLGTLLAQHGEARLADRLHQLLNA